MSRFGNLAKLLKRSKKEEPKETKQILESESEQEVDKEAISKIVDRMRDKYIKEGVLKEGEEEQGRLKMLLAGEREKIGIEASARELALYQSPLVKLFGKFYLVLESPISFLTKKFRKKFGRRLELDLLSSGMNYSVEQYISLALSATTLTWMILVLILSLFVISEKMAVMSAVLIALFVPFLIMFVILTIPSGKANKIAFKIEKELPFALRHMSIEIRAGVGIYKTMESIAKSGYGPLSDGFKWVLSQIEKGVPTEDALQAWAERTKSDSLNRVVSHLVRALRTGGNLSDVMVTIAEDVSFERKSRIADFAEKLNLLGLFLMMVTVVFPVMVTILTTIASTPTIAQYLGMFSFFSPNFLILVYFIIVPSMVGVFLYFIRSSDPG